MFDYFATLMPYSNKAAEQKLTIKAQLDELAVKINADIQASFKYPSNVCVACCNKLQFIQCLRNVHVVVWSTK